MGNTSNNVFIHVKPDKPSALPPRHRTYVTLCVESHVPPNREQIGTAIANEANNLFMAHNIESALRDMRVTRVMVDPTTRYNPDDARFL